MSVRTWLGTLAVVVALALAPSACGRKGAPEAPPGSDYPRTYPSR